MNWVIRRKFNRDKFLHMNMLMKKRMKELGCSRPKMFLYLFPQIPIFSGYFFGLKKMADETTILQDGGTLWFKNLAEGDYTFGLPILSALFIIASFEVSSITLNFIQLYSVEFQQSSHIIAQFDSLCFDDWCLLQLNSEGLPKANVWYSRMMVWGSACILVALSLRFPAVLIFFTVTTHHF